MPIITQLNTKCRAPPSDGKEYNPPINPTLGGIFMEHYNQKIELYFVLKDTPLSSRESYWRRMQAFLSYMQKLDKPLKLPMKKIFKDISST